MVDEKTISFHLNYTVVDFFGTIAPFARLQKSLEGGCSNMG